MSLKLSQPDGVKTYTLTASKAVPNWLTEKKKRELRKDEEYNRRCGGGGRKAGRAVEGGHCLQKRGDRRRRFLKPKALSVLFPPPPVPFCPTPRLCPWTRLGLDIGLMTAAAASCGSLVQEPATDNALPSICTGNDATQQSRRPVGQ